MKAKIRRLISEEPKLSKLEKSMTLRALESIERGETTKRGRGSPTRIHEEVLKASAEELIAAGWGVYERCLIPPDWKTRKPGHVQ